VLTELPKTSSEAQAAPKHANRFGVLARSLLYSRGASILIAGIVRKSTMILDLIRRLKARDDVSVIIVAHNYAHVFDVSDRVNLLQNGRITFDQATKDTSVEELLNLVLHEIREARLRP
jgi:ABC-type thiamine transport system ATPase subunit